MVGKLINQSYKIVLKSAHTSNCSQQFYVNFNWLNLLAHFITMNDVLGMNHGFKKNETRDLKISCYAWNEEYTT